MNVRDVIIMGSYRSFRVQVVVDPSTQICNLLQLSETARNHTKAMKITVYEKPT
jgi:hypothetical protein